MLFVQANNYRQQVILSEQYNRQGNIFAVPLSKPKQLSSIIKSIVLQIFQKQSQGKHNQSMQLAESKYLFEKLKDLIENMVRSKLSLSQVRQLFLKIYSLCRRLKNYEQYFLQINAKFMEEEKQDSILQNLSSKSFPIQNKLSGQSELNVNGKLETPMKYQEIKDLQCYDSFDLQSPRNINLQKDKNLKILSHFNEIDSSYLGESNTIKGQIFKSPRFAETRFQELETQKNNIQTIQFENSFEVLEQQNQKIDNMAIKVNQISGNYGSEQKKQSIQNNCQFSLDLSNQNQKTKKDKQKNQANDCDYIDNLSGRVQFVPSFLHDEDGIKQMIIKQKKQDVRKSLILKQSMKLTDTSSHASTNDKMYNSSLRNIKLNNKLRRNSRKSLNKKQIDELRQYSQILKNKSPIKRQTSIQELNEKLFNTQKKINAENIHKDNKKVSTFFKYKKY